MEARDVHWLPAVVFEGGRQARKRGRQAGDQMTCWKPAAIDRRRWLPLAQLQNRAEAAEQDRVELVASQLVGEGHEGRSSEQYEQVAEQWVALGDPLGLCGGISWGHPTEV